MLSTISHTKAAPVGFYWDKLKDLDYENKLELINLLSASLLITVHTPKRKTSLDECFGAWNMPISYSDAELMSDIDAVCAEKSDFIMVTENTKDFINIQDIQLENWIQR